MHNFETKRKKKLFEIVAIVKIIYILLSIVVVLSVYGVDNYNLSSMKIAHITSIGIIFLLIVYQGWLMSYKNEDINRNPQKKDIIETVLFLVLSTILVFISGYETSRYKFIYIFMILVSTIQFGKKYGSVVAIISSIFILGLDLVNMNNSYNVNMYFQIDLVLSGAFALTAWLLGVYVSVEREYSSEMKILANVDELTGLYNHRYFQESLAKSIEEADKNKSEISLLFMDIDYFKYYNDMYGHQAGDKILEQIGKILMENVRDNDIVARYGGEEFAVILPNTSEVEAMRIGEKIRYNIQNNYFYGQETQPNNHITMSIGVSSYPTKSKNKHQLINTSDDALYRAKFFNRNRVEVYYSILEEIAKDTKVEHDIITSIKAFISMINKKDKYMYGHTERVVIYCNSFANYINLDEKDKKTLRFGAYLHDIGKIEIPEAVLNKREKLTDEEFDLLRQHSRNGVELIQHIDSFKDFIPLILHHHERYDGRGYPNGLKGYEIPYLARILTIADSFDAMTSNRPYNTRKSYDQAIIELRRCSGTQFDPELVELFIEMIEVNKENFSGYAAS